MMFKNFHVYAWQMKNMIRHNIKKSSINIRRFSTINSIVDDRPVLVIVESPTKVKTIQNYLGDNYLVDFCAGHIRDLSSGLKDIGKMVIHIII